MRLVDTHTHLEDVENLDEALTRAEEAGIIAVIAMGSDYETNRWVLEESLKHERNRLKIYQAVGLHPMGLDMSQIDETFRLI
ncbi:MAG: TatD family hydrolase, partial [Candidatus Bathyarchaeia archaeon]